MRAITILAAVSGYEKMFKIQYRQDSGSRWSTWTESWLDGSWVRINTAKHIEEVLFEINNAKRYTYEVKYELI